jgi:glycosyltransferase involved in cell wall biosynthesis
MAGVLFDEITAQAQGLPVEILLLLDNKARSVGLKRDALVQSSRGEYVAFVDDDDDVDHNYIELILDAASSHPDVIVFDTLVSLNDGPIVRCSHDLDFPNDQYNPAGFRRGAWQMHAWRGDLARSVHFPDNVHAQAEDWPWCEALGKLARSSVKIPRALYFYRYSDASTEASK